MSRTTFKPGNMLYPVPAVLISCTDGEGHDNVFTVAWAGTICSDPPMVSISVRSSRLSHEYISKTKQFVINLTTKDLARATDYCGVKSGRNTGKFADMKLTKMRSLQVEAPSIKESPVAIECQVENIVPLGTHDMFIAKVVAVTVDDTYMDKKGTFHFEKTNPIAYSHGEYYTLGEKLGKFGYSVRK